MTLFTTAQVAEMTGASLRQLQWWCEQSIVSPACVNGFRAWDNRDIRRVLYVQAFRAKHISLRRARAILDEIEKSRRMPGWIATTVSGPLTFFADDDPHEVLVVVSDWSAPAVIVYIGLRDVSLLVA
jgi:hypothetical protein